MFCVLLKTYIKMTTTAHESYIEEKGFWETVLNTVLFIGIITLRAQINCNSLFMGLLQTQVWHQCEHKF